MAPCGVSMRDAIRHIIGVFLPLGLAGAYAGWLAPVLAQWISAYIGLWEIILAVINASAILLAMLFGQWRAVVGLFLIVASYAVLRMASVIPAENWIPLLVALPALGLVAAGMARERGPAAIGPLAGLAALVLAGGVALRGNVLGDPGTVLEASLSIGMHLSIQFPELLAATGVFLLAIRQAWKPEVVRAGILAAAVPLVALAGHSELEPLSLTLAGGSIAILLLGLLIHAWYLAFVDELTGLPGRRALESRLLRGAPMVAMVDVDHFKQFNDRWGHDVGDQVLRRVASVLQRTGAGAKAYRYGGEEFALVFGHGRIRPALEALEKTRQTLAARPFRIRRSRRDPANRGRGGGPRAEVTASFGLALPRPGETVHQTLKRADRAMYRAKKNGRNRIETLD